VYSKYWALPIAKVEHKAENQFSSIVEFDLIVLSFCLLPNDHETLGQGTKVPQMQTKTQKFFHLIVRNLWK